MQLTGVIVSFAVRVQASKRRSQVPGWYLVTLPLNDYSLLSALEGKRSRGLWLGGEGQGAGRNPRSPDTCGQLLYEVVHSHKQSLTSVRFSLRAVTWRRRQLFFQSIAINTFPMALLSAAGGTVLALATCAPSAFGLACLYD